MLRRTSRPCRCRRFPENSKYWIVCADFAWALLKELAILTPSMGFCATPLTIVGCGSPASSSTVGAMSIRWWYWAAYLAFRRDRLRPAENRGIGGAAVLRVELE